MDQRVRYPSLPQLLQMAQDNLQARIWTAMPGIIQSFDATKQTCVVHVAIQIRFTKPDGSDDWKDVPPLQDCPLVFPQGGGLCLTFPVAAGDECLVVFASRCIDAWWQSGGDTNRQPDLRMHDLSDGFVIAGVRSQPRKLDPAPSADSAQLRTDDGAVFVEVKAAGITLMGDVTIQGDVAVIGALTATDEITAKSGSPGSVTLSEHIHGYDDSGTPADTAPPTGGT